MFFDLAKSLRSLTRSPIHSVIHEAHRFACHHLESGGNVTPHNTIGDQDFVLPPDVSASAVATAIKDWLRSQRFSSRKRGNDAAPAFPQLWATPMLSIALARSARAFQSSSSVLIRFAFSARSRNLAFSLLAARSIVCSTSKGQTEIITRK